MTHRQKYGRAKLAVIQASEAGMTYAEAAAKSGFPPKTLHEIARRLGLSLKRNKQ